jgi:elongation factor P
MLLSLARRAAAPRRRLLSSAPLGRVVQASALRAGNVMVLNGDFGKPLSVAKQPTTVKPGKGGTYVVVETRDLMAGRKSQTRLRTDEKVQLVRVESKERELLYHTADEVVTSCPETFEQFEVPLAALGDADRARLVPWLDVDNLPITLVTYGDHIIECLPPQQVEAVVESCPPSMGGGEGKSASGFKVGALENGVPVKIPTFVDAGERIVVDLRGEEGCTYVRRADR